MSVARNTAYNFGASLVPIAISFITVPLTIEAVGVARFGVMALFTLMLGYFGIFDFGLSVATAQRVASTPPHDVDQRRRIVWTALGVNLAFGVVGAAGVLPVAELLLVNGLKAPVELRTEIAGTIVWLSLAMPLMLLTGVCRGAMQGAGRFAEMNLINVIGSPATQVLPLLAALYISPRLDVVVPILFATRAAFLVACAWVVASRVIGGWKPAFDRRRVRDLLSFGGWVAISSLITPIMTALDRFAIGWQMGAQAVSHYTVPLQLAERTLVVPGALVEALLPRLAAAETEDAHAVARRSLQAIAAVMTPAMVIGILIMHPFLQLWIGSEFAEESAGAGRLLLAGFWFVSLGLCCRYRLNAAGRPHLVAITHLMEVVPYVLLLVLALRIFGLPGAAMVFALRAVAEALILAGFGGLARDLLNVSLFPALFLALALAIGPSIHIGSTAGLVEAIVLATSATMFGLIQAYRQQPEVRRIVSRVLVWRQTRPQ